jgi:uncharacterized protein (TIGR00251 family)
MKLWMKNSKNSTRTICVKVVTNSKKPRIEESNDRFLVCVSEKPDDGKANEAVIRSISSYFDVGRTSVRIIKGEKSRIKVIEITG